MEATLTILLLLIASFVFMMSLIYGHIEVASWLRDRWAKNKRQERLITIGVIIVSLMPALVPSYAGGCIRQSGLLPPGNPSDIFIVAFFTTWYPLILGLGLKRLLQDYYRLFTRQKHIPDTPDNTK